MDNRPECSYKDKCYRKKEDHFEKFRHPHLEELLEKIGAHEIHVPFGHVPNVSFDTLKLQLEIEKKVKANKISDEFEPEVKRVKLGRVNLIDEALEGTSLINGGESPAKDNRAPGLNRNVSSPSNSSSKGDRALQAIQNSNQEVIRSGPSVDASEPGTSVEFVGSPSQTGLSKKTFEKQRVSAAQHAENMREAAEFRAQVQSQIRMNIGDKLKATSPYNILYTTLEVGPNYSPDRLSVTFPELLDSPLGLLEESLLINFMVQFGWVLACYFSMGHSNKPITLLFGDIDTDLGTKFSKFLKYAQIKPPSSFGSHHTKMMIYSYLDKSIRVVVCTANLIESDWVNKTQGVWISDKCEEMLPDETGGESKTNFKKDLLAYLEAYKLPVLQPWIEKVKRADMSNINVFFIGSTPGSNAVSEGRWGQARLRSVLKSHAPIVENNSYKVIAQLSSIGSLGPNPDSWLMGEMLTTFSTTKPSTTLLSRPPLSVIYPSFLNVENCAEGLLGGGCLPYSSQAHRRQEWFCNYLSQWKSDAIGRSRAIPHIKSYTRVSSDNSKISYFLLTSANLSKAAWGTISKSQTVNILSYEAGVLLLPEFIFGEGEYFFPLIDKATENGQKRPTFSLPYDLPLTPYGPYDIPWFIDNLPS